MSTSSTSTFAVVLASARDIGRSSNEVIFMEKGVVSQSSPFFTCHRGGVRSPKYSIFPSEGKRSVETFSRPKSLALCAIHTAARE